MKKTLIALAALSLVSCRMETGKSLESGFMNPPSDVQTSVYWYWISGNVTKEGVEKDLESMKTAGINRAFIGNIGLDESEHVARGPVDVMSEEWFEIMHAAMKKATELGIEIGVFNSPGWSQAGGPWVKPEQSMRYLNSVSADADGGKEISLILKPEADFFQDVRTIAWKTDGNEKSYKEYGCGVAMTPGQVETLAFSPEPDFVMRSLRITPARTPGIIDARLWADAGNGMEMIREFTVDRSNPTVDVGFKPYAPVVVAIEPLKAKAVRLELRCVNGAPGIASAEITSANLVERYAEKSLAKMYQTPLPYWDAYMWDVEADSRSKEAALDPESIVDVTEYMCGDTLRWNAPKGHWRILRTGMTPTGAKNGPALSDGSGYEIDKWSRKHLESHYDAFIGELVRRIPAEDRTCWKVIVADSYEKGGQNFSDDFFEAFKKNYGYDALPYLPVFEGYTVGDRGMSDRFLWDLRRMVADRLAYDHIGGLRDLAHKDGFTTWLENYGHWGFPGEFLQYGGQSDEVAGEFWSEGDLGNIENRAASSCAHIYGKNKVSAESFTAAGKLFARYPYLMKQRGDRFFSEGINNTLLHVYISQPDVHPLPGQNAWFGNEFNRNNTWFKDIDLFTTYLKRCDFMLQQGLNVADVAYFIGEDAPKMTGLAEPSLPQGFQFDYINAEVLIRDAFVKDGLLTLPHGTQYKVLVLPKQETMRPELAEKIESLVKDGAVVLGPAPDRSPSLAGYPEADARVKAVSERLWGDGSGIRKKSNTVGRGHVYQDGISLEALMAEEGIIPDCRFDAPVVYCHRHLADEEVYFIANQSEERIEFPAEFRVSGLVPQWWNPVTGEIRDLRSYVDNGKTSSIAFRLEPLESGFVVFRRGLSTRNESVMGNVDGAMDISASADVNFPQPQTVLDLSDNVWNLHIESMDGISADRELPSTMDMSKSEDDELRYFSGTASWSTSFDYTVSGDDRIYLDCGRVGVMAKVYVNEKYAGGVWTFPYRVDITDALRSGENEVRIDVTNTWHNRLVGESRLEENDRKCWVAVGSWTPDMPLQESGLVGPVRIMK